MKSNLWILSEERPKRNVLSLIIEKFCKDHKAPCFVDRIRILPMLEGNKFSFVYEVIGIKSQIIENVYLITVSGYSSFVDYLVFYQDHKPNDLSRPLYVIEETKTDDSESRNTGIYQRCSKFVYAQEFYPEAEMLMLYNLQVEQKKTPTETNIFGTRLLLTIGVEIMGKIIDKDLFIPFKSVDDVIEFKSSMRKPPKGNVPITITKQANKISISGRLVKNGYLSHDPNIGALSLISLAFRKLGWTGEIEITSHGLVQDQLKGENKFVRIANYLSLKLDGLTLPNSRNKDLYWKYESKSEKLGTIFVHLVVENFTCGFSIFENHAGCEKGYFITKDGSHIPLAKYSDREKYKAGDKDEIIHIPDLILLDFERGQIVNVEGKKYEFRDQGICDLENYDFIEENYIEKYYPGLKIVRTVVLYGSYESKLIEIQIGFLLNQKGEMILGVKAPELFQEAIKNLLDYWNSSELQD